MIRTLRTYGYAAASEVVVALSNFGLLFLLGSRYSGELVAFYLLVRRVIAVVVPAINLGMPLGLLRNLVLMKHGGRLVTLSLAVPFMGLALLSVLVLLTPEGLTTFAFGAQGYGEYAMPLLVAVAGIVLTTISVSLLRGRLRIAAATTQLIVALGALPLLLAWLTPDIRSFLLTLGSSQGVLAALIIALDLKSSWRAETLEVGGLLWFGVKAMSAEFCMMILLWLPPTTISRSESVAVSGYFSLILSLAMMLSSPVAPIATSVMPRISAAVGNADHALLRRIVLVVLAVAVAGGIAMVVAGSLAYDFIARAVLGDAEPLGPRASLVMLSTTIPLAIIFALRNMIDVVWSPFRNTLVIAGGIGIFLATREAVQVWTLFTTRVGVVLGFAVAVWAMAVLVGAHGAYVVWLSRSRTIQ